MTQNVEYWIDRLSSGDLTQQGQAAESLAKLGEGAKPAAIPLVKQAGASDETLREWVVSALESLGVPDAGDVTELRQLAASGTDETAYWAMTLLGRLESRAAAGVPELTEALRESPFPHNRQRAAWALGKIGPAAAPAIPELKASAHGDDARLARIALLAIQSIEDSV